MSGERETVTVPLVIYSCPMLESHAESEMHAPLPAAMIARVSTFSKVTSSVDRVVLARPPVCFA